MATKKKDESTLLGVSENTAQKLAEYQAGYKEGERVQNAYNEYNQLKQNAPQAYVSPYQQQLDTLYEQIANRQPFKYSLNGDMLYQNAKEQYQQLGKQAMVDTIGKATQLTGGYGNSYAQNAGNQAYQQYLLRLNEQIPTYQNLAMQRYQMEGDQLNNQYGLLRDRENEAYGRYRDTVSDYNNNLSMAYNVYNNERDNDYGRYADALNYWQNQAGAENKDYWTQTNFDYQAQQDALSQANWERQFAWEQQKAQQDLAYKYAALAQQRAAAEQKAKEEEERKKKEEEEQKNSREALLNESKKYSLTRYASNTGLGLNSKGIGVALTADDSRAAGVAKMTEKQENTKSAITPQNEKNPELKKMDLKLNTSGSVLETADYLSEQALKMQNSAKYAGNETAFKNDLFDTLEYYYNNGLIDNNTAKLLISKFGL